MTDSAELVLFPEDTTPYTPVGSITVGAPDLLRALTAVIHAASTDDARPLLNSVTIQPRTEEARFVAADNYRVAMCDVDADVDFAADWIAPVPAAVEDVKRLIAVLKSIPDIRLESCTAQVVLTLGRRDAESMDAPRRLDAFVDDDTPIARLPLRVIDGLYPNVAAIIPVDPEHIATFTGHYLAEAAKFGASFEPGGLIQQARSGGTDGPFVFTNGRFTEVVMPVKADAPRPAAPTRIVDRETGEILEASGVKPGWTPKGDPNPAWRVTDEPCAHDAFGCATHNAPWPAAAKACWAVPA